MLNSEIYFLTILQDAKNGAEIKAVDAYCWLHSTVHLDTSLMRKLNTLPKIRDGLISMRTVAAMPNCKSRKRPTPIRSNGYMLGSNFGR